MGFLGAQGWDERAGSQSLSFSSFLHHSALRCGQHRVETTPISVLLSPGSCMLNVASEATCLGGDAHPVPIGLADLVPSEPSIHAPVELAIHILVILFMY